MDNSRLTIDTDRLHDRVTIVVHSDVNFNDSEVEAINLLGLHYTLSCQIVSVDRWDKRLVAILDDLNFPTDAELTVSNREHALLSSDRPMADLHTPFMANDNLQAQLSLRNDTTGETVSESLTPLVTVNLAA
jgi:hypothetical protein